MTSDHNTVAVDDPNAELGRMLADHSSFVEPHLLLAQLRARCPVNFAGPMAVTASYNATVEAGRSRQLSRQRQAIEEASAHTSGSLDEDIVQARRANIAMLINQDDPGHARIRKILDFAFRPSAVVKWQELVDRITTELVDAVIGKAEFDFGRELAYPLPERVICELAGVPYEDHALWGAWAEDIVGAARTHEPEEGTVGRVEAAQANFLRYFRDLVAERKKNLGDDLVSVLIRAEAEGERLSEQELYGTLQMLVTAGHETTANLIINGMVALLRHPDQYTLLREEPSLVAKAVEEMLRYESPAQWALPREAVEDTKLDGVRIPAGSPVIMALNAANRDPAIFEHPDVFDIRRDTTRHIAFGTGVHFCLGNQLARMEARAMFGQVVNRLPRLEAKNLPQVRRTFTRSYDQLIVRIAE